VPVTVTPYVVRLWVLPSVIFIHKMIHLKEQYLCIMFYFEVYKLLLKLIRCYDLCLGRKK